MTKIKIYTKYLIDEYQKIKIGDGGRVLTNLEDFYNEGKIKDVVYKNSKINTKIEVLDFYRNRILIFAKNHEIKLELMDFDNFFINFVKNES